LVAYLFAGVKMHSF